MACGSFYFFSFGLLKRKGPIELGAMLRTLLFKRIRDMASLVRCYQTFLWVGFLRCFCNYQVGRHVEINLKLLHGLWVKTHMFGRHVELIKINDMAF
jgi:hypothetical protein